MNMDQHIKLCCLVNPYQTCTACNESVCSDCLDFLSEWAKGIREAGEPIPHWSIPCRVCSKDVYSKYATVGEKLSASLQQTNF